MDLGFHHRNQKGLKQANGVGLLVGLFLNRCLFLNRSTAV